MWRRPDNRLNSGDAYQAIAPQSNKVSVPDAHVAGNAYYTAICSNGCFSMLFCRCREGVRVELALRLAPSIHGYGPTM